MKKIQKLLHYFADLDSKYNSNIFSIIENFNLIVRNILFEFYVDYTLDQILNSNVQNKYNIKMNKFLYLNNFNIYNVFQALEDNDIMLYNNYKYYFPPEFIFFHLSDVIISLLNYLLDSAKWKSVSKNVERLFKIKKLIQTIYDNFIKTTIYTIDKVIDLMNDESISINNKIKNDFFVYYKKNLLSKNNIITEEDINQFIEDLIILKQFLKTPDLY